MKTRSFPWALIAVAAVAGAGFAGVATYVKANSGAPVGTQSPDGPGEVVRQHQDPQNTNTPKNAGDTNEAPQKVSKVETLNKVLKANNYGEFRVLNVSVEDNGNAIIDFNKELLGGMGSGAEADFIDLVTKTMAQFSEVKTFQIRIDGQIQKSLSHFEMLDPIPVR